MRSAVETRYAGHLFRSRLEARWAALFDLLEWEWTYEPFNGNGYLPDFLIHGPSPLLVEVKPEVNLSDLEAHVPKVEAGLTDMWAHDVLIVGASPILDDYLVGLLAEWVRDTWPEAPEKSTGGSGDDDQTGEKTPTGNDSGASKSPFTPLEDFSRVLCEVCDQPGELVLIQGSHVHVDCAPASWKPDPF